MRRSQRSRLCSRGVYVDPDRPEAVPPCAWCSGNRYSLAPPPLLGSVRTCQSLARGERPAFAPRAKAARRFSVAFEQFLELLDDFVRKHGSAGVLYSERVGNFPLGHRATYYRSRYRQGRIRPEADPLTRRRAAIPCLDVAPAGKTLCGRAPSSRAFRESRRARRRARRARRGGISARVLGESSATRAARRRPGQGAGAEAPVRARLEMESGGPAFLRRAGYPAHVRRARRACPRGGRPCRERIPPRDLGQSPPA